MTSKKIKKLSENENMDDSDSGSDDTQSDDDEIVGQNEASI